MKSKSKFTVKIPSEIYKGEVFITAFFIVLNVMYTIYGNPPHFSMYISTILFVFIPIAISLLWIRKLKIVVSGSKITVRKILGFKYSVDVSEITKIKWIINDTRLGVNEKILIYVNSEHFAVETLMDGFEIMSEYLLKNPDFFLSFSHPPHIVSHKTRTPKTDMLKHVYVLFDFRLCFLGI